MKILQCRDAIYRVSGGEPEYHHNHTHTSYVPLVAEAIELGMKFQSMCEGDSRSHCVFVWSGATRPYMTHTLSPHLLRSYDLTFLHFRYFAGHDQGFHHHTLYR